MHTLTMNLHSVGYSDNTVLSGIELAVAKGEICGFIGPNGSGKSSLLKAILDIEVNVRGEVYLNGTLSSKMNEKQRAKIVSYLPQNFNPSSELTVLETVLLGRHPYHRGWEPDSDKDIKTALACLRETDIYEIRNRKFTKLSGGEKKLVLLASALAQEPDLLLLDEPGSSLDFKHQLQLWTLLKKLSNRGISVIVSTHELAIGGKYLDSVLVIADGGCRLQGKPEDVFAPEVLNKVFDVELSITRDQATGSWIILPRETI